MFNVVKNYLRIYLIALFIFPCLSSASPVMDLLHHRTFTPHPCADLTVNCLSNKGHHFIGILFIAQSPRMVRDRMVCLPHGKLYSKDFVEKTIHQCTVTYPYSCKKGGGCSPVFVIKSL